MFGSPLASPSSARHWKPGLGRAALSALLGVTLPTMQQAEGDQAPRQITGYAVDSRVGLAFLILGFLAFEKPSFLPKVFNAGN